MVGQSDGCFGGRFVFAGELGEGEGLLVDLEEKGFVEDGWVPFDDSFWRVLEGRGGPWWDVDIAAFGGRSLGEFVGNLIVNAKCGTDQIQVAV